jgi:hypothetical protein
VSETTAQELTSAAARAVESDGDVTPAGGDDLRRGAAAGGTGPPSRRRDFGDRPCHLSPARAELAMIADGLAHRACTGADAGEGAHPSAEAVDSTKRRSV